MCQYNSNVHFEGIFNIWGPRILICLPPNSVIFARHETEGVNETKYSRMDQVKFLKAVFHKFYLVRSWIICG